MTSSGQNERVHRKAADAGPSPGDLESREGGVAAAEPPAHGDLWVFGYG